MSERKQVNIADVKFMLANGVTRTTADKNYNAELGSIESHYGLDAGQVALMFRDPRMAGMRFKKVAVAQFVLNEEEATITELPRMNNTTVAMGVEAPVSEYGGVIAEEQVFSVEG
jgi:hypothetical protein